MSHFILSKAIVENSLGSSLKIRICYRNRCRVLVTAQLDRTNTFWCHEPGTPESENFDLVSQDED
ncbi:hypothetical protein T06_809 [Trichinella sp. T6]|nr:hypothetical protein T06_809 [Trichinella sp. T6]